MKLSEHPSVLAYHKKKITLGNQRSKRLNAADVKQMALEAGADDVGIIDIHRDAVSSSRQDLLDIMPDIKSIVVMAFQVNQSNLRSLAQSVTDHEFKHMYMTAGHVGRTLAVKLREKQIQAVNMPSGFHQELPRWPGKIWLTEDKVYAAEAGLGHMGYNRLIIHPGFGASVILGTVLVSAECDEYDHPVDFNPCIKCGLCVKVCPVGAVKSTDNFDMLACLTHNYRERLGGFQNWVEQIVESKSTTDYRRRVSDQETVSMWQHLAIGSQNKCDRCMAVCPAGEGSIGEFIDDRKSFIDRYVNRFTELSETVYVVKGSASEKHVRARFPNKQVKHVSNGIRPTTAARFLTSLPLAFAPHKAAGMDAVYHFSFTGDERLEATVAITNQSVSVENGFHGTPDLHLTADSRTWIRFLTREISLLKALISRKIKVKGSLKLMAKFAQCFPN